MKRIIALLLPLLLAGCISVSIEMPPTPTPNAPTLTPAVAVVTIVSTATPTTAAPAPTPYGPSPTPDMPEPASSLNLGGTPGEPPRVLYYLDGGGLWRMRPQDGASDRLTGADVVVTAFDTVEESGRLAFATRSGKLYTQMPGGDPQILFKIDNTGAPYPAYINGLDWSPDGSQLAYTVTLDGGGEPVYTGFPAAPSGVWTLSLETGKRTWLVSSRYPASAEAGPRYRVFSDPQWSPDSLGLIVRASYGQSSNIHWLYPLRYAEDESSLHALDLPRYIDSNFGARWGYATWTPDSQGLIFSSQENVTFGDLGFALRDGSMVNLWQAGQRASLYIANARMLPPESFLPATPDGIASGPGRIVYLASCPTCPDPAAFRLYVIKSPQVDQEMPSTSIGPESLCTRKDASGSPNIPRAIQWTTDHAFGVLTCGANEIYVITLYTPTPILYDITAAARVTAAGGGDALPVFRWGK